MIAIKIDRSKKPVKQYNVFHYYDINAIKLSCVCLLSGASGVSIRTSKLNKTKIMALLFIFFWKDMSLN